MSESADSGTERPEPDAFDHAETMYQVGLGSADSDTESVTIKACDPGEGLWDAQESSDWPSKAADIIAVTLDLQEWRNDDRTIAAVCAALSLDPDAVLDGPLVVLHPGQHVVERRQEVKPGEHTLTEGTFWTPWVVVASGPEVTG